MVSSCGWDWVELYLHSGLDKHIDAHVAIRHTDFLAAAVTTKLASCTSLRRTINTNIALTASRAMTKLYSGCFNAIASVAACCGCYCGLYHDDEGIDGYFYYLYYFSSSHDF